MNKSSFNASVCELLHISNDTLNIAHELVKLKKSLQDDETPNEMTQVCHEYQTHSPQSPDDLIRY